MRIELYGVYMTDNMCAAAGPETATTKECQGDRNCSLNADCKPISYDSIIKTGEYCCISDLQSFLSSWVLFLYRHHSNTDTSLIQTPL